jgi:uncharacterized protein
MVWDFNCVFSFLSTILWTKILQAATLEQIIFLRTRDARFYSLHNLVDAPDAVQVNMTDDPEKGILVEVKVSEDDIAKVVGRQGRTIKSLRTLVMIVGARLGKKVRLELIS